MERGSVRLVRLDGQIAFVELSGPPLFILDIPGDVRRARSLPPGDRADQPVAWCTFDGSGCLPAKGGRQEWAATGAIG